MDTNNNTTIRLKVAKVGRNYMLTDENKLMLEKIGRHFILDVNDRKMKIRVRTRIKRKAFKKGNDLVVNAATGAVHWK